MKYLLIGLVFLVMGCQTITEEKISPVVKEGSAEVVEEKQSKKPTENLNPELIRTTKPVLCAEVKSIMARLSDLGEVPVASWYDQTGGYPVLFLINKKNGTSSVLEFPGQAFPNGPFKNLACFVSVGVKTVLNVPEKKEMETKVQFSY